MFSLTLSLAIWLNTFLLPCTEVGAGTEVPKRRAPPARGISTEGGG